AVFVSGIVALTLSPMMSSLLLQPAGRQKPALERHIERQIGRLSTWYGALLDRTLAVRGAVLLVGVVVLVAVGVFFSGLRHELAPAEDQGGLNIITRAPKYAAASYTVPYLAPLDELLDSMPEYQSSYIHIGGSRGENQMYGGVILKHWSERERSSADIQREIQALGSKLEGVTFTAIQRAPLPGTSGGLPVQMVLRSADPMPTLFQTAEIAKTAIADSSMFAFVQNQLAYDSTQAHISIDRARANEMGITMQAIADTLAVLVGDNYVNRFNFYERSYEVIPQVRDADRMTPEDIGRLHVKTATGALVPLSTVATITLRPQINQLTQFGQMNSVTLEAVPAPGVTMGEALAFLESLPLPAGTTVDWLGESRQFVQEGNRLLISFGFALIVIFLVLAAQFESLRDPLVILVTVPLAICGALAPLWLGYATLNIYTQIGLITLIGLISKHGILMVTFANQIQHSENLNRIEAIRKAAVVRMRPILMTTAAMVTGLIPLVFASGPGSASHFSIGIVVVTGMLVGTLFTLFVLPTIYTFIAKDHRASAASSRERELALPESFA
ncbi:MAG: efflux RND transporter permease subunit, partial [Spongiibacteraceae bacterium]|nr:efflux RND transporter permease subunit [Spongiibacteraceae bacterium]